MKADQYVASKMLDLDLIGWTAKAVLNLDLFPIQIAILQIMWTHPFPMLVASRGGSKSFILAVYAILRALLDPGSKIVIVGAGLRQAKIVFNYIDQVWNSAPVFRSIIGSGKKAGPRQSVDLCYFKIGESIVYALPLGDGCARGDTQITYSDTFGTIADDQPSNIRQKNIINRIRKVWGDKNFNETDESYCNGIKKTKKITTRSSMEFEGTHNHQIKIVRDGEIRWVRLDEIAIGDRVPLDRSWRWHNGHADITSDESYALGLLVGDGSYIFPYRIGFATNDIELAKAMQAIIPIKQIPSDPQHWVCNSKPKRTALLNRFGIHHYKTKDKQFPGTILKSSRDVTSAFISGLFDSDGHVQVQIAKGGTAITVGFTNTSKRLVEQLQYILLHYGIVAHVSSRKRDENWERCYELLITGTDVLKFATEIGFRLKRKQDKLLAGIEKKKRWMDQGDSIPDVLEDMIDIAENNKPKWHTGCCVSVCAGRLKVRKSASRPLVNNFLRVYGHLPDPRVSQIRCLADPNIYYDEVVSTVDSECVTFDIHVPNTHEYCANGFYSHNTKIRGFRANVVIADEFSSIPEDVFDIVVRGFTATTKTPVDEAKRLAFEKTVATLDIPDDIKLALKKEAVDGNQIIHSGTAYYEFNHFAQKHRMWCDLIESKGHGAKVAEIFGGQNLIPDNFDYRDYVVIQIPHTHLPEGLLDPKQLAHAKALLPRNIFLMEYGCVFIKDSDGFYCRSLIESCTVMPNNPIATPDGPVTFTPLMRGVKNRTYVIGIDPAAERDKFAIVVLEVWENHYRVVHCWSVNKPEFNKRKKQGLVTDDDYYAYCCSKIRNMVKLFNPIRIEMDSQGGGYPISEMLRNKKLLNVEEKDFPIYEVIDQDDPKETDGETDGRHILNLVKQDNTSNAEANVALHKSLETKRLLFPAFDAVKMESSILAEKAMNVIFDTFEECVNNIEELKNELCTIQMSATATGKERFDTPSVVSAGAVEGRQRKGRLKKDRFTALMLSHKFLYDTDTRPTELIDYEDVAGNFKQVKTKPDEGMYRGPGAASMHNAKDWQGEAGQFGAVKKGERH